MEGANRRNTLEAFIAGCRYITGETAKPWPGVLVDTGGGRVNGRCDITVAILQRYDA
jgi:hypothetical protein